MASLGVERHFDRELASSAIAHTPTDDDSLQLTHRYAALTSQSKLVDSKQESPSSSLPLALPYDEASGKDTQRRAAISSKNQLLYQNNPYHYLVDALAYLDPLSSEIEQAVKLLIDEEMKQILAEAKNQGDVGSSVKGEEEEGKNSGDEDDTRLICRRYLDDSTFSVGDHLDEQGSVLGAELLRCSEGKLMQTLDFSCYDDLEEPSGLKSNDVEAWRKYIERLQCVLEHSSNSIVNLELMIRFAKRAWTDSLEIQDASNKQLKAEVATVLSDIEAVNKKRRLEQIDCGNYLRNWSRENEELMKRNNETSAALIDLEMEVFNLVNSCELRGVLPEKYRSDALGFSVDRSDLEEEMIDEDESDEAEKEEGSEEEAEQESEDEEEMENKVCEEDDEEEEEDDSQRDTLSEASEARRLMNENSEENDDMEAEGS